LTRNTLGAMGNPPIMSRINIAFYTPAWKKILCNSYPPSLLILHIRSLPHSTHPLITPHLRPRFRFEAFWVDMPGLLETVQEAWNRKTPPTINSLFTLHVKFSRTTKALNSWSKSMISHCKLSMAICREATE
jgi:hypothetical protein